MWKINWRRSNWQEERNWNSIIHHIFWGGERNAVHYRRIATFGQLRCWCCYCCFSFYYYWFRKIHGVHIVRALSLNGRGWIVFASIRFLCNQHTHTVNKMCRVEWTLIKFIFIFIFISSNLIIKLFKLFILFRSINHVQLLFGFLYVVARRRRRRRSYSYVCCTFCLLYFLFVVNFLCCFTLSHSCYDHSPGSIHFSFLFLPFAQWTISIIQSIYHKQCQ